MCILIGDRWYKWSKCLYHLSHQFSSNYSHVLNPWDGRLLVSDSLPTWDMRYQSTGVDDPCCRLHRACILAWPRLRILSYKRWASSSANTKTYAPPRSTTEPAQIIWYHRTCSLSCDTCLCKITGTENARCVHTLFLFRLISRPLYVCMYNLKR